MSIFKVSVKATLEKLHGVDHGQQLKVKQIKNYPKFITWFSWNHGESVG